jgi:acyl-CoA dehydrogenase
VGLGDALAGSAAHEASPFAQHSKGDPRMDFDLPAETIELRERARRFFTEVLLPLEKPISPAGEPSNETVSRLQSEARSYGLWQLDVPVEYGGQGRGLLDVCVVAEEVERSPVLPFRQNDILGPKPGAILYSLSPEQQDRYLLPVLRGEKRTCFAQTEPGAGSDPASLSTAAVRRGDGYVLNGTKRFIGAADRADFAQVICRTKADGDDRGGDISCLLVDMDSPGVELVRPWPTMMGDAPWEIRFSDVHVPVENLVGQSGTGFSLAQRWLTHGRIKNHGARCTGIADRALAMSIAHATQRQTFGEPLADRQAVQFMVADSVIELEAARLLLYRCAWAYDQGRPVKDESYIVKLTCTETAGRIVDRAIQIHGAIGLTTDLPLEYWYRQLRSMRITEGAAEVLRWRLARNVMRAQ